MVVADSKGHIQEVLAKPGVSTPRIFKKPTTTPLISPRGSRRAEDPKFTTFSPYRKSLVPAVLINSPEVNRQLKKFSFPENRLKSMKNEVEDRD